MKYASHSIGGFFYRTLRSNYGMWQEVAAKAVEEQAVVAMVAVEMVVTVAKVAEEMGGEEAAG